QWKVTLKPLKAGGPFTMRFSGAPSTGPSATSSGPSGSGQGNTITFTNIVVGEVWVCSGQSNMMYPLQSCEGGPEAIAASKDSMLRLLRTPRQKGIATS